MASTLPCHDDFGGYSFNILSSRRRSRRAAYSIRHVPWGNYNIMHLAGKFHEELDSEVYIPSQNVLTGLMSLIGTQGTLRWAEGQQTAALVSVETLDWYPNWQQTVRLLFILAVD
jgi:hypothetical protein